MCPRTAHGLHRGPFFVSDPRYHCHGRARERLYPRARLCARYGDAYTYATPALGISEPSSSAF
nr:MAG TPA: hypothetical protein [Bacteriophage sp.]